ncbi:MAG: hypothetical protein E6R08_00345 [Nevskiaceae bacterium]|nr:MAG: hypothetical protein E6R08_00345 [Nevskiaceae bacterium]
MQPIELRPDKSPGTSSAFGSHTSAQPSMHDDPMTKEAWSLAATFLSQDGLVVPALLLWKENDDAVKLARLDHEGATGDVAADALACAEGFDFDHAILIARTVVGLVAPDDGPAMGKRQGVSLSYVSRRGDRYVQFSQIVDIDGVIQLAEPTLLPALGNALDVIFRWQSSTH